VTEGRPTLLLTGFEPFGTWKRNVSGEAVSKLAGEVRGGHRVRVVVLPVAWPRAKRVLDSAVARAKPDVIVSFGIHGGKNDAFYVEAKAANSLRFRIDDNDGNRFRGARIEPKGPRARGATLPVPELQRALRARGLDARRSRSAGRFLCNAIYYTVLGHGVPAVFVHVPPGKAAPVLEAVEATVEVATRRR
jgi:pyroglutamyl-peptidase